MADIKQIQVGSTTYDIKDDDASIVSVSASGTATDEVQYITIDGVEKKLAGGGGDTDLSIVGGKLCVTYEEE